MSSSVFRGESEGGESRTKKRTILSKNTYSTTKQPLLPFVCQQSPNHEDTIVSMTSVERVHGQVTTFSQH